MNDPEPEMNISTSGDKELFAFLVNAPKEFREGEKIRKFQLQNGDYIHCVLWNMHFYITGTDIVKILVWRFQNAGRQLQSIKKFEEGVFSDLRNLKPGIDATLEGPRSDFLEFLYKNGCIRTQKKQKVFYWYSVPHDALFCDALERDLRRETNLYTYSKYMSNIATQSFKDPLDPFPIPPQQYTRHAHTLKKKNNVKLATRNKRSPPPNHIFKSQPMRLHQPSNKPNAYGMIEPLEDASKYMPFDTFNPTHPDPFVDFGSSMNDFNFNFSMNEDFPMATQDYGSFHGSYSQQDDKIYAMPDFFAQNKQDQMNMPGLDNDNTQSSSIGNTTFISNIPNSHGNMQK